MIEIVLQNIILVHSNIYILFLKQAMISWSINRNPIWNPDK
jgi:hypothetical protein